MAQTNYEHNSHHKSWVHIVVRPPARTCMTSKVNFQPTGFVILFIASRKGAGKELLFSEVGSIMGK